MLEDVKNETTDDYINCEFIPCSAAICECLWSKKDVMLPQRRSGISPVMSEQLLILNENLELWNVDDVAEALRRVQENEKIDRTKRRGCRTIKLRKHSLLTRPRLLVGAGRRCLV